MIGQYEECLGVQRSLRKVVMGPFSASANSQACDGQPRTAVALEAAGSLGTDAQVIKKSKQFQASPK